MKFSVVGWGLSATGTLKYGDGGEYMRASKYLE